MRADLYSRAHALQPPHPGSGPLMNTCPFCGRDNEAGSRFCIDCGKPLSSSAAIESTAYAATGTGHAFQSASSMPATMIEQPGLSGVSAPPRAPGAHLTPGVSGQGSACPRCAKPVEPGMPFCANCGAHVGTAESNPASCPECGATYQKDVDLFCARCGHRVGQRVSVAVPVGDRRTPGGRLSIGRSESDFPTAPRLALLSETGEIKSVYTLERGEAIIGRTDADIQFGEDHFMSPLHARVDLREGTLWIRDLGSRNGSWVFIDEPTKLTDGDRMLVGSQILRFRRLGYPGPHPPEADSTRRMGSTTPSVDVAILEQLRADGSVRDTLHLSPGRNIRLGREVGDWIFPYDSTMSGKHAELRTEDSEFFIHDADSRNGVAMAVRGERALKPGQRMMLGDAILRIESV